MTRLAIVAGLAAVTTTVVAVAAYLSRHSHVTGYAVIPTNPSYLYRWYVIPRNRRLNIYLHKFGASDDQSNGLHDHRWDFISMATWLLRRSIGRIHCRRSGVACHRTQQNAGSLLAPVASIPGRMAQMSLFGVVSSAW